jgi:hypothetical protein
MARVAHETKSAEPGVSSFWIDPRGASAATGKPVIVATLIGEGGVSLGLECFESWLRCVPFDELLVYEDGTLTDASRLQITQLNPRIRIVGKQEADQRFADTFDHERFPLLSKLRNHFPLGRKIVDVPAFSKGWINYIDSDVYFYRPVEVLWTQQTGCKKFWMMKDFQNIYSTKPWQLLPGMGTPLPQRANSGLISCEANCYDPAFLESVLQRDLSQQSTWTWVIEQTLWAALGWRSKLEFYDPNLIGLATDENRAKIGRMAALHWAGLFRSQFEPSRSRGDGKAHAQLDQRVTSLAFEPAVRLTWGHVARSLLQYQFKHTLRHLSSILNKGTN